MKVSGHKQLMKNLEALSPALFKKHTRRAVDKAAKVVKLRARQNAHRIRNTGALSRAMDHKTIANHKKRIVAAFIGPSWDHSEAAITQKGKRTSRSIKPSEYAHVVEFGAPNHPPKPFLRPALHSATKDAEGIMANEMREGLDQVVNSLPTS